MELIDTHCHLNDEAFDADLTAVLDHADKQGVKEMIVIGVDKTSGLRAIELAEAFDNIYAGIAWHPVDVIDCTAEDKAWLESVWEHPKVVAVGETGLDYHWEKSPKDLQQAYFRWHLEMAIKNDLPFVIHDRDAHEDTLAILREFHAQYGQLRGVMHSYSAGAALAEQFLALGLHLSISGVVTFKNAQDVKDVVSLIPDDRLLVETDAPYLSPVPFRGKRNEPAYTYYTAEEVAKLRGVSLHDVANITTENARKLFKLHANI